MKRLQLITLIATSLVVPVLASDHGRDRRDRGNRRPAFGVGIHVAPAYPVYGNGGGRVYGPPQDPYGAYGSSVYDDDPYYGNVDNRYSAYAPYAPPAPRREYCGPAPGPGYVWVDGFWRWDRGRYLWAPGLWMRPPHARASWMAGGWYRSGGNYGWRRGYWRR